MTPPGEKLYAFVQPFFSNLGKAADELQGGQERHFRIGASAIVLREVMNTVGKAGKLGEQIRCVVSVSMLTEGWNANTVKIYPAIAASTPGEKALKPILRPYDTIGSTRHVDFDTTKPTYTTRADRCQVSHVAADTDSWEQKLAQTLENMPEVFAYIKKPKPRLHHSLHAERRGTQLLSRFHRPH
jgi:hypothetical protein